MESRYSMRWRRRNGESVAIETMSDRELVAARHMLEREDPFDPIAAALYDAVDQELDRRANEPAQIEPRRAA